LVIASLAWWSGPIAELTTTIDLCARFENAQKRSDQSAGDALAVALVSINGDTRRSIFAHPTATLAWRLNVPENARLRVALGIRPEAWNRSGNGVVFRVGVASGGRYEELLRRHVHPMLWAADRRWVPVTVDLSPFGSQEVDLVLSTETGPDRERVDSRFDWAVWGLPEVVAYRQ
jgi:hypothetical protein